MPAWRAHPDQPELAYLDDIGGDTAGGGTSLCQGGRTKRLEKQILPKEGVESERNQAHDGGGRGTHKEGALYASLQESFGLINVDFILFVAMGGEPRLFYARTSEIPEACDEDAMA